MSLSFAPTLVSAPADWMLAVATLALSVPFAVAAGATIGYVAVFLADVLDVAR